MKKSTLLSLCLFTIGHHLGLKHRSGSRLVVGPHGHACTRVGHHARVDRPLRERVLAGGSICDR